MLLQWLNESINIFSVATVPWKLLDPRLLKSQTVGQFPCTVSPLAPSYRTGSADALGPLQVARRTRTSLRELLDNNEVDRNIRIMPSVPSATLAITQAVPSPVVETPSAPHPFVEPVEIGRLESMIHISKLAHMSFLENVNNFVPTFKMSKFRVFRDISNS